MHVCEVRPIQRRNPFLRPPKLDFFLFAVGFVCSSCFWAGAVELSTTFPSAGVSAGAWLFSFKGTTFIVSTFATVALFSSPVASLVESGTALSFSASFLFCSASLTFCKNKVSDEFWAKQLEKGKKIVIFHSSGNFYELVIHLYLH